MITILFLHAITFLSFIARHVSIEHVEIIETLIFKLLSFAPRLKPMPRRRAKLGKPFIGKAMCEDINCRHRWTVVTREGCHESITLNCPECGNDSGGLI